MNKNSIDILLISENIFDGKKEIINGYVAISGNKIVKVGTGEIDKSLIGRNTKVFDLGDKVVTPGFADVHTFFSGYVIYHIGVDMSSITTMNECLEVLKKYETTLEDGKTLFGHNWNPEKFEGTDIKEALNEHFPHRSIIIFSEDRSNCMMNDIAISTYCFTPDKCYPESYYRIMKEYLNDRSFIDREFEKYMKMMNSKGVTTVKEMGFDNYYGFTDYLEEKEKKSELTMRIFFMSQPVGREIDIDYGKEMTGKFKGDFVRFSGYNRMIDGTIASGKGDLTEPYEGTDRHCSMDIDYKMIEEEVILADKNGFRYSLHAQGDRAVQKALDIFAECEMKEGKCLRRHAITDLEFTNPKDLERMGRMGVIAEIYPQIMSLDKGSIFVGDIERTIGKERGIYYWNRRKMEDSGVIISCATDLPLMITDIPESIYHSCGGYFKDGKEPFNKQNTLSIKELLSAWTLGGQKNLGMEDKLGTLEEGKLADVAVLNSNIFKSSFEEIKETRVCLTISDGRIVYNKL